MYYIIFYRWKERFPSAQRIMHKLDCSKSTKTHECEILLEGLGIWDPEPGVKIIHTPGHTPGSICLQVEVIRTMMFFLNFVVIIVFIII